MHPDESSLADGARKHAQEIHKKGSFRISVFTSKHKGKRKASISQLCSPTSDTETLAVPVEFRDKRKNKDDQGKLDQFRWATLYENQRGHVSL